MKTFSTPWSRHYAFSSIGGIAMTVVCALAVNVFCGLFPFRPASTEAAPPPPPEGVKPLETGAAAPDFTLPGVDGKDHSLADYAGADVLAVLFTCNHCPSAQAAEQRVIQMVNDYKDKSFQLVAISPNDPLSIRLNELGYSMYGDTLEEMKLHAKEQGFNFPYLYDGETQATSMAYGAMATPHIFIFDKDRKLRYQGRIDDSKYADPALVKSQDARNAIDALLAGQPVPVETTRFFGCSTKWAYKRDLVTKYNEEFEKKPVTLDLVDAEGVKKLLANDTDKVRLINLWATFCAPCMVEFPDLVEVGRQFETRGFEFVSISTDAVEKKESALRFLTKVHAAMPDRTEKSVQAEGRTTNNYLFEGESDEALIQAIGNGWDGSLPFTLLIAPGGEVLKTFQGDVADPTELRQAILDHLGRFYE